MKKKLFFTIIFLVLISLFLPKNSLNAFAFPEDKVLVYENDKAIETNSVVFVSLQSIHSKLCENGVCNIAQNFYPVKIFKFENIKDVLTYAEFQFNHPYKGGKYDGSAKYEWMEENKKNYLDYLNKNTKYSTSFNPNISDSTDSKIGSRSRTFKFDIVTGEYKKINTTAKDSSILSYLIPILFVILVITLISYLKKKK